MPTTYDDYRPTSTLSWGKDGKEVVRTLYIRAADELAVLLVAGCPQRGDELAVTDGSYPELIYCDSVVATHLDSVAAEGGLFLFEVVATYQALSGSNPTINKARWGVSFRPQQNNLKNVADEAHQAHYGPSGSAAAAWPEVTTGINVTDDGPQGVDVDEMVEVLSIEFWKHPDDVEAFLGVVRALRNRVNNAALDGPWGSYAAGEARLTGLGVSITSGEMASVTIEISISENSAGISVFLDSMGATVSVPKNGWEYLWVRSLKGSKEDEDDVRPLAIDAHVATFYESGDYSTLGISDGLWV